MRGLWWILLPALAGGCAGTHASGCEEASAAIGICFDAGAGAQIREQVAGQLARQDVELVGCMGAKPESGQTPQVEWRRPSEFEGVRSAAPLPQPPAGPRFGYSFERGPMHLTVIETADPMTVNSEAYLWLMEDLSLTRKPWKVVILSRPILTASPIRVDRARMDLAELLARERVALALAAGGPEYFRSARIGESRPESVRYVILGGDGSGAPPGPMPEWTARAISEPCFCVLEATTRRLRWTARDLRGRMLDLLDVPAGEGAMSRTAPEGEDPTDQAEPAVAVPASRARTFTWSEVLASERAQTTKEE